MILIIKAFLLLCLAYNISGRECEHRRLDLCEKLNDLLTISDEPSSFVKQNQVLALLNMYGEDKSRLTRAMKSLFPQSRRKTVDVAGQEEYPCFI